MPYIEKKDRITYDDDIKEWSAGIEKSTPNRSTQMRENILLLISNVYWSQGIYNDTPCSVSLKRIASNVPKDPVARPGHLNYIISSLIDQVYGLKMRYSDHNEAVGLLESIIKEINHHEIEILGMLRCAQLEFYRRRTSPYEDEKIVSNGDIR